MRIILFQLLFGTLLTSCSSVLYYPSRTKYVNPEKLNPPPKEITYYENKSKNEKLVAWHFTANKPKATIVIFHGNAQNVSSHFMAMHWAIAKGYNLFIFDYPGYGGSHGEPTPKNTVESGLYATKYVRKHWPDLPMIIVGQSIGGAIAMRTLIELKEHQNICAAVIDSSFLSYKEIARRVLAKNWLTWPFQYLAYILLSDRHAPGKRVAEISPIPILVVHRKEDPVIPVELGEEVFKQAKEPKQLLILSGQGHINSFTGPDHQYSQKQFLDFVQVCNNKN